MNTEMIGVREPIPVKETQTVLSARDRLRQFGRISQILVQGRGVPSIIEPVVVRRAEGTGTILGWWELARRGVVTYHNAGDCEVKVLYTLSD